MESSDFVAFVWRIRNAMAEKKDSHRFIGRRGKDLNLRPPWS
jgi:hypothetical protein